MATTNSIIPPPVVGTTNTVAASPVPVSRSSTAAGNPPPVPMATEMSQKPPLHPVVEALAKAAASPTNVGSSAVGGGYGGAYGGALAGVNAQYDPQISDLNTQIGLTQTNAAKSKADIEKQTQQSQANAKLIYDALHNTLAGLNHQEQAGFANTQIGVGKNYDALTQQLSDLFSGQNQGLNNESARLGLNAALGNASQGLRSGHDIIQGLADTSRANTGAVLWNERRGFDAIGKNAAERAHYTGAERISQLAQLSLKEIGQLEQDTNNQLALLRSKVGSLTAAKGQAAQAAISQLQQQRAQLAQAAAYKQAEYNLEVRRLQDSEGKTQFDQTYKLAQLSGNGGKPLKGLDAVNALANSLALDSSGKPFLGGRLPSTPQTRNEAAQDLMTLFEQNWTPKGGTDPNIVGSSLYSMATGNTKGLDAGRLDALINRESENTTTQRAMFGSSGPEQQAQLAAVLSQLYNAYSQGYSGR